MKQLLYNLLQKWSCLHIWKIHKEVDVYDDNSERPYETRQTLICTKCGKIKQLKL